MRRRAVWMIEARLCYLRRRSADDDSCLTSRSLPLLLKGGHPLRCGIHWKLPSVSQLEVI